MTTLEENFSYISYPQSTMTFSLTLALDPTYSAHPTTLSLETTYSLLN